MNKQLLFLSILSTATAFGMQQETTHMSKNNRCSGVTRAVFKRRAKINLTKAITYYFLKHKDVEVDDESQVAGAIELYLLAQKAHKDGDEKEYEQKLLTSAHIPYRQSLKELSQLYLKRAEENYQKAHELGDEQAGAILAGLKQYSFKHLLIGKRKEKDVVPLGLFL